MENEKMKYGHVFFTVQTRVSTDRHHQEAPLLRLCFCDSDAIVQDSSYLQQSRRALNFFTIIKTIIRIVCTGRDI